MPRARRRFPPDVYPPDVRTTKDRGVYVVRSKSRRHIWHRVDVEVLTCNCERATKGVSKQAQKRDGKLMYKFMCDHLREALAFHALLMIEILAPKIHDGP